MAKTELKLKTKNAATGQAITTTVGYVNPTANSQTLKTFGQMLNNMTTNTYEETDRVQTINVDTEEVVLPKKDQTIQVGETWTVRNTQTGHSYKVNTFQAQGVTAATAKTAGGTILESGIGQGSGDSSIFGADEVYVENLDANINVTLVASGNSEYNGSSLVVAIPRG